MGACDFMMKAKGKSAREAFSAARSAALHAHGHDGYSGSIAEKSEFVMIAVPADAKPVAFARGLIDAADPRIDDKDGPAGCIDLGDGAWLFFGWAAE